MTKRLNAERGILLRSIKDSAFYYPAIILVLSLLYYLSYANYGLIEGDWGMIAVAAERFMQGKVFYRDFSIIYTPGIYIYTALFFKLLGVSLSSATIGWSILRALNCLIIYLIGSELVSRRKALVLPFLLWFVPGVLHKSFFVFFVLLSILILIKALSARNILFYFLSGIVAGIILLFRIDLFGFFLIAFVIVEIFKLTLPDNESAFMPGIRTTLKNMLSLSVGVIVGNTPLVLYLIANSAMTEAYRQLVEYPAAMKSLWFDLPPLDQIFSLNISAIQKYIGLSFPIALYVLIFVIMIVIVAARDYKEVSGKDRKFLVVLLFGGMTLNQAIMYPGVSRIGMMLSPVLIVTVYAIDRFFRRRNCYSRKHRIMYSASLGGVLLMLLSFLILSCIVSDIYVNNSIFIRLSKPAFMSDQRLHVYTEDDYLGKFNKVKDAIETLTEEGEYVFAFPGSYQIFHFVTGRTSFEKLSLIGEYLKSDERQREVIRLLEEKNVRVIIAELAVEVNKRKKWAPVLNEYIMKHYTPEQKVDSFSILVRCPYEGRC